ncbi:hypothetical protein [Vibrio brasiliensis]|uniref:Uncharacterized protein n=1 Tax=Vibrio brasiliensis LMG 20546 TaxID=945543 RepID=E8LZ24_9VIBR|nr:hypothetical protein [Vibrio brasiliensis]EGA64010.1 hypothetical protein VIBR0546_05952 [Vibrio brasiliensis LMG 20546]
MERITISQLSQKSDEEINQFKGEIISDYISSDKVSWRNKKFALDQQKIIDEMIETVPVTDSALPLLLTELTSKLGLLHESLAELKRLQDQAIQRGERDENK